MRLGIGSLLASAALIVSGCSGGPASTSASPPPTAPAVTTVTPASGATGVTISAAITASFSEAVNASTISSSSFTVTSTGGAVAGTVSYSSSNNTATFTPSASLAFGTRYTATITTAATGADGAPLAADYSWSFTTAPAPAPTVSAVMPANAETAVSIVSPVTAAFSEAMNASSLTGATFTLAAPGGAVIGTVTYSSSSLMATFTPTTPLAYSTQYTATITTGATAANGAAQAANYTWSFTTAVAPPPVPAVTAVSPADGATEVPTNQVVTATFSQAMSMSTLNNSFTLAAQGGGAVAGVVDYSSGSMAAAFTPSAPLAYNTTYTATITTGAQSAAGAALAANVIWSFKTAGPSAPTVTSTVPANSATGVAVNQVLTATFSAAMNSSSLNASTFTLTGPGGAVAGVVAYSPSSTTATFTPSANFAYSAQYTATITTGAQSAAGAELAGSYQWTFTTSANPALATIEFSSPEQTIRGFGGSTAWLGQLTTQQATALFNPVSGLGLSILRVRIDPEGSAGSDWQTGQWTTELNNGLAALAANPNAIVFASPWTPPPSMKTSSTSQPYYSGGAACSPGSGYCGGYLDPARYSDYATYLEHFVSYFADNGVNLYAISMQNEPDYSAAPGENYESCSWTAAQMDAWIAANASVLTTKLIMPESYNFNEAQSNTALQDSSAVNRIAILGEHLYGVSNPLPHYRAAENDGKDVWMTEHSLTPGGSQPTISDALAAAEEVHNSMTTGGYNAYVWWWIWDNTADGINYGLINSSTSSPVPTYYGYALGQFARFIQPGYVRYDATASPQSNVYVSAYSGVQSSATHYVIVVINAASASVTQSFTLQGCVVTSLTPYQTTSAGGLVQQPAVVVSSGQFTYTLPAQSITTFVQ